VSKEKLYKTVLTKTGKPDWLAISLYLDIKANLQSKKQSILKTSYSYFANKYKCSTETIRKRFVLLENLGLIKRNFTNEVLLSGYTTNNVLNLILLEGGKKA
jgi:hypothetical protein